jgi:predicted enzyme related to lactoylglutathione lyase
MTQPLTVAPVRTSVTVAVSREHAFAVFTERFDTWWPRSHHTGPGELAEVRLEPHEGGRWYEVRSDGSQGEWGRVLAWEPPTRLLLAWQLDATFHYDPGFVTEVEVTFIAQTPHRTEVVLEHRRLEQYGERSREIRESIGSAGGWPEILGSFAQLAGSVDSPAPARQDVAMGIRTSRWPAGVPCWADLTVPDVDAAKAFYAAVLGWSYQPTDPEFGGYAIGEVHGGAAGGIGPLPPGAPVAWTMYFASDDADKTAAAVGEHGGTILMPPDDVGPLGRMFIAADPTGATFGVWEAGTHIGAAAVNQPGGLVWEDLRSPDPQAARAFYTAVFGHRTEPMAEAGPGYHTFTHPDEQAPLGGMGPMTGPGEQPYWLVYFGVADTEAAVSAAEASGGTVVNPVFDTPFGKMAGLKDPAGALFWIVETSDEDQVGRAG